MVISIFLICLKLYLHCQKRKYLSQLFFVTIATAIIIFVLNILINNFNFNATSILIFGIAFMRLTPTFKLFQHNIGRLVELLPSYIFCESIYNNSKKLAIINKGKDTNLKLKYSERS